MRPPRRLSEEEIAVWRDVTRTVDPLPGATRPDTVRNRSPARAQHASGTAALDVAARDAAPGETEEAPPRPSAPSYSPPVSMPRPGSGATALERRIRRRIASGRIGIDATLDLHGMTQAEAHGALLHFLVRAQRTDARLVLVVTGKGRLVRLGPEGSAGSGVLRRMVPHWLRDRALAAVVHGFEEAGRGHGGMGALYIRLKRRAE